MSLCWLWHRWTKWTDPAEETFVYVFLNPNQRAHVEWVQYRTCDRCGMKQRREIRR